MNRARTINRTTAILWIEKDAIAVGVFDQALAISDLPYKLSFEIVDLILHPQFSSQGLDLPILYPNVSGAPLQQLPHCEHSNESPSWYQGVERSVLLLVIPFSLQDGVDGMFQSIKIGSLRSMAKAEPQGATTRLGS